MFKCSKFETKSRTLHDTCTTALPLSFIFRLNLRLNLLHIPPGGRVQLKQRPNRIHRSMLHANLTAIERDATVRHTVDECLVSEVRFEQLTPVVFERLQ